MFFKFCMGSCPKGQLLFLYGKSIAKRFPEAPVAVRPHFAGTEREDGMYREGDALRRMAVEVAGRRKRRT